MTFTGTTTETGTRSFTYTDALYLASKVVADLHKFRRRYGEPSSPSPECFGEELSLLMFYGYVAVIKYGFVLGGRWVIGPLKYEFCDLSKSGVSPKDDDPGGIPYTKKPSGSEFISSVKYSNTWINLCEEDKLKFRGINPIKRYPGNDYAGGEIPYPSRQYSSGGRSLKRG